MTEKIPLKKLLYSISESNSDCEISGLSMDSRNIKSGDLFVACLGETFDGRKYISEAIANGAAAIICEGKDWDYKKTFSTRVPIIPIIDLRKFIGIIAARFYDDPSANMTVIGVTGTNGKTSCSQFTARALEMAGKKCGVMGTLGIGFPDHLQPIALTTPDALTLQKELSQLKSENANYISMEVSSHSLAQYRVDGVHFHTAMFTNLTRDHLDYHGNMTKYANAKKRLFENFQLKNAVINLDDEYGRQFLMDIPDSVNIVGYALKNISHTHANVYAENIRLSEKGFVADVKTPWGSGQLQSRLLGRFNVSNLLAVLTTLNLLEIPFEKALEYLANLDTVVGRMQFFGGDQQPIVVVDYAHTPDALEQALKALREHCRGKLWCVFGCGGERDRGKRPLMAEVAEKHSDKVIVTDDNPRREYSQKIIEDIVQGLLYPHLAITIPDRRTAIIYAIKNAQPEDIILIAGKGHEPYQIIGEEKLPFSDAEEVQQALKN